MQHISIVSGADDAAIAQWLHERLSAALSASADRIAISLPGGSTPFPILERLCTMDLDWGRIAVWPGDDRLVPEDNAASNVGRIRALLEPAGASVIALDPALDPPHFALVWLGMGADGHIASLFPDTDPRPDDPQRIRRLTPDPLPPEAPFERVSLTLPALLDADQWLFVVRGTEKAAVFKAAAFGETDLPVARLLGNARRPVTCFT